MIRLDKMLAHMGYGTRKEVKEFSQIATISEIQNNDNKLSISLYVRGETSDEIKSTDDAISEWMSSKSNMWSELNMLCELLEGGKSDGSD